MKEMDFESLLALYGSDEQNWPAERRNEARVLLASSLPARRLMAETVAMEAALRSAPDPVAPEGMDERIMAALHAEIAKPAVTPAEAVSPLAWVLRSVKRLWLHGVGFAGASALGVAIGVAGVVPGTEPAVDGSAYVLGMDETDLTLVSLIEDQP